AIDEVAALYHRLILVVAPTGAGKTTALREVVKHTGFGYINVGLDLSQRLLELTERQRPLRVPHLLDEVTGKRREQVVLLDSTELLFDVTLKQDPLRCLQQLSRSRTVVATWNGRLEGGYLVYAQPDHAEYRRYLAGDLVIISLPGAA